MPQVLPGNGGEKYLEEAKLREVKKRRKRDEVRRVEKEVMNVIEDREQREVDAAEGGVTWKATEKGSSGE